MKWKGFRKGAKSRITVKKGRLDDEPLTPGRPEAPQTAVTLRGVTGAVRESGARLALGWDLPQASSRPVEGNSGGWCQRRLQHCSATPG